MLREIGGRRIGPASPVFVIAEIGLNHGGSVSRAVELVDAAASAGAGAIKLPTLVANRLVAPLCPPPAPGQAPAAPGIVGQGEVGRALRVARRAGADQMAVLHCVSAYPAPLESQNLRAIRTLADAFALPTGLSDHGSGLASAAAAVALGAVIYERHLVLEDDKTAIDRAVS